MSSGTDVPDTYTTTTRYAPYIESAHGNLIYLAQNYREWAWDLSPYSAYEVTDPAEAFFMAGYIISNYPTVYDMFGKFQAGLDIEVLWNQIMSDSAYGAVISEMINADSDIMEDELDEQIAELFAQADAINAVMTSAFIIAEGNMRSKKIYAVAKELGELRIRFTELAQRRWEKHLNWNSDVINTFLKVNELFFTLQDKYLQRKEAVEVGGLLWGFTLLDHERAIVACLQGAVTSETKGPKKGSSGWETASNVLGMAAGGMEMIASFAALPFFSDIRLKKNITSIKGIYNKIGLRCYTWKWNSKAALFGLFGETKGVIAQEVLKLYPQAVSVFRGYLRVDYALLDRLCMKEG